jgi:mono/diheme cytochrome c family protein
MKRLLTIAGLLAMAAPGFAADAPKQVTFSKDVAPIFQKKCQECHQPNSIAPMSLITYQEARPWARSIKERVATRQMPPWRSAFIRPKPARACASAFRSSDSFRGLGDSE